MIRQTKQARRTVRKMVDHMRSLKNRDELWFRGETLMAQRRNGHMVSTRLTKDEYLRLNELAEAQGSNVYKLLRDMIAERLEASRAA